MNVLRQINTLDVAMLVVMLLLLLGVYANSLDNPFLVDDDNIIATHPDVIEDGGLIALWRHDYWADREPSKNLYRPVTILSYYLNARLPGAWSPARDGERVLSQMHPRAFRLVNIGLLGVLGWMVGLWLGRYVNRGAAWIAALLFVLHPSNAFVVNYVVGRADLLAGLGVVGFAYMQRLAIENNRWTWWQIIAALMFALVGLGSKESGLILLPVAIAQAWIAWGNNNKAAHPGTHLVTGLLALVVTIPYLVARLCVVGSAWNNPGVPTKDLTSNPLLGVDFLQRLPAGLSIGWFYAKQIVWPDTGFYHIPNAIPTWTSLTTYLGLITLLAGAILLVVLLRRRHWLSIALVGGAAHYLLIANLIVPVGVYAANRLMIPFLLGGAMMVSAIINRLRSGSAQRWSVLAAACIMAGGVMVHSVANDINKRWSRFDRLSGGEVARQPDNLVAKYIHATALIGRGRELRGKEGLAKMNEAVALLRQVVAGRPDSIEARMQLANSYLLLRRDDEALKQYQAILELDGQIVGALDKAAALLIMKNQYAQAEKLLERAYVLDGHNAAVLHNRAVVAAMRKRYSQAVRRYQQLLEEYPDHNPGRQEFEQLQRLLYQLGNETR